MDFDRKVMNLRDVEGGKDVNVSFDFCVGADGSYSIIRRQLMRVVRCVYPIDPSIFPTSLELLMAMLTRNEPTHAPTGWTTSRSTSPTNISN